MGTREIIRAFGAAAVAVALGSMATATADEAGEAAQGRLIPAPPSPRLPGSVVTEADVWDHHGAVTRAQEERANTPATLTGEGPGYEGGPHLTLGRLLAMPLAEIRLAMPWEAARPVLEAGGWVLESRRIELKTGYTAERIAADLAGRPIDEDKVPGASGAVRFNRLRSDDYKDLLQLELFAGDDGEPAVSEIIFGRYFAAPIPNQLIKTYAGVFFERYGPPTVLRETSKPGPTGGPELKIEAEYLPAGYPVPEMFKDDCIAGPRPHSAVRPLEGAGLLPSHCAGDLSSRTAIREAMLMSSPDDRSDLSWKMSWSVERENLRIRSRTH